MKIYVNTVLETVELLFPYQMDNEIDLHIKNNLINNYEGRCFKNYGFINKIYAILEIKQKQINSEDINSSQFFFVKFSCQLYYVIRGKEVICKMDKINEKISVAINGPLNVIITPDLINIKISNKIALVKNMFV